MRNIGNLRMVLAGFLGLGLALPVQATYTGLLVTSGGNLYEITSGGVLTLVTTYSGVSLGAAAQGSKNSTTSDLWFLDSAGTDLYEITLQVIGGENVIGQSHIGSLGVTGTGLTYIGGTLYTLSYNSTSGSYDAYTVSQSTGAASLAASSLLSPLDNITTDGTLLLTTQSATGGHGDVVAFNVSTWRASSTHTCQYVYGPSSYVGEDLAAFDGTNIWFIDNSTNELSDSAIGTGGQKTVTVKATSVYTYNGMCWGYVPF